MSEEKVNKEINTVTIDRTTDPFRKVVISGFDFHVEMYSSYKEDKLESIKKQAIESVKMINKRERRDIG